MLVCMYEYLYDMEYLKCSEIIDYVVVAIVPCYGSCKYCNHTILSKVFAINPHLIELPYGMS